MSDCVSLCPRLLGCQTKTKVIIFPSWWNRSLCSISRATWVSLYKELSRQHLLLNFDLPAVVTTLLLLFRVESAIWETRRTSLAHTLAVSKSFLPETRTEVPKRRLSIHFEFVHGHVQQRRRSTGGHSCAVGMALHLQASSPCPLGQKRGHGGGVLNRNRAETLVGTEMVRSAPWSKLAPTLMIWTRGYSAPWQRSRGGLKSAPLLPELPCRHFSAPADSRVSAPVTPPGGDPQALPPAGTRRWWPCQRHQTQTTSYQRTFKVH